MGNCRMDDVTTNGEESSSGIPDEFNVCGLGAGLGMFPPAPPRCRPKEAWPHSLHELKF